MFIRSRRQVVLTYVALYPDPIRIRGGEQVELQRQDDEYPGWWWCQSAEGRQGWVPESILEINGAKARILVDYDARELSVKTGDVVETLQYLGGWVWVTNTEGQSGWIPEKCLAPRNLDRGQ